MRCVRALLVLLCLAAALPASAAEIRFDAERRDALLSLPVRHGVPLIGDALAERVVVLAFFASWCPPCHPEMDHLKAIDSRYRAQGVRVLAVNIFEDFGGGDDRKRLDRFLEAKDPDFPVLAEGERVAARFGPVERIPTLFVFAPDGTPALHFVHARGAEKTHAGYVEIAAAVEAALARGG